MIDSFTNIAWIFITILILVSGLFFSWLLRWIQFSKISKIIKMFQDKKTGISLFQSFTMSLASRIGVGSLSGISLAIFIGGYGTIFWIWVTSIIGSSTAIFESVLASKFRVRHNKISVGGPPFYIKYGLKKKVLGNIYSVLMMITYSLLFVSIQSTTIVVSINNISGINKLIITLILLTFVGVIIFGGLKKIATSTEKIVPFMGIAYISISIIILVYNFDLVDDFFINIFSGIFKTNSVIGGTIGTTIIQGMRRGVFSNEAGIGTGAYAAASAEVSHDAKSGYTQSLSVLFTSLVIGTITAFIVFSSSINLQSFIYFYNQGSLSGIEIMNLAMYSHLSYFGSIFLTVIIFFFAFSTIIIAYYYGEVNLIYLFEKKYGIILLRIFILFVIFISTFIKIRFLWNLTDFFVGVIAFINILSVMFLHKIALRNIKKYRL